MADVNVISTPIAGSTTLALSSLVSVIPAFLANTYTADDTFKLVFKNNTLIPTQFVLPTLDFNQLFDNNKYNANFFQAFQQDFPASVNHQYLFGLKVTIINDLPYTRISYLDKNEVAAFRFLNCLIFGLLFSIKLDCCSCYPQNLAEYSAVRAGLGLNCVNLDCKNALKLDPLLYDDLLHSPDCSDVNIQAAFVSFSVFSGGDVNTNINISQTTRDLAVIADPLFLLPIGSIISEFPGANFANPSFARCDGSRTPKNSKIKAKYLPDLRSVEIGLRLKFFIKIFD